MRTLALALLLSTAACSRSEAPPPPAAPAAVAKDPAAAKKLIAAGAVVLDVRTPEEYEDGHLPAAVNVPVDTIGTQLAQVDQLVGGDKARAIVVYCKAGSRAAKAKTALEDAGYTHVVNGGGLADLR
jgi:phage shock protein E